MIEVTACLGLGGVRLRSGALGEEVGGRDFEHQPAGHGIRLLRPARKGEPERPGAELFKPLRQVIESANGTFKSRLNLDSTTAAHPPASSSPASCSASSH